MVFLQGVIDMELTLLPKDKAITMPVGIGRNPPCPLPEPRFVFHAYSVYVVPTNLFYSKIVTSTKLVQTDTNIIIKFLSICLCS